MSDELSTVSNVAAHGGGVLASGGLAMWLTNFFRSRKEEAAEAKRIEADKALAVQLSQLDGKVDQLLHAQAKTEGLGERLALLERDVKALHERFDGRKKR